MLKALGVIGLATMGGNIARNAAHAGFEVAVYNRTQERLDKFMEAHGKEGKFTACQTTQELCKNLAAPRAILLMVKAGEAVDAMIQELVPFLEKGDILIDGGNSHFRDTERRQKMLSAVGIHLVGMGISGGEEGALKGPSMMPGGDEKAYKFLEPMLQTLAANDGDGGKCVTHIGPGGAGHFVKMVHNGIEYGIMQLIAETYDILKKAGGLSNEELAEVFTEWNSGDLRSFLIEITADIFKAKDPETNKHYIDFIKDTAGQKGTGKWTTESAMNYGVAIPTITAAVDARLLSGFPDLRERRSKLFAEELLDVEISKKDLIAGARVALELSTLSAYSQGFDLLAVASAREKWNLPLVEIARIWRGGCIIRSHLLGVMQKAYGGTAKEMEQEQKAMVDRFGKGRQKQWRNIVSLALAKGIPVPASAASLAYFDSIRNTNLPLNLVQAQRDYFGAHTYERTDKKGVFHTQWKQ